MHYGLDADVLDFVQRRCLTMRDSIAELLDFVDDFAQDLVFVNDRILLLLIAIGIYLA